MTLPRFLALVVGAVSALAVLVLALAVRTSGAVVIRVGDAARAARAAQLAAAVEADLNTAEHAIEDFERALDEGVVDDGDPLSLRRYLLTELLALRGLTELTVTAGHLQRYDDDGEAQLSPEHRRQLSVFRDGDGHLRDQPAAPFVAGSMADPTRHDTFRAAAHREARGQALWSDLAFAEHDAALPAEQQRKALTVQKAIFVARTNRFVGVLRAGITSGTLDRLGATTTPGDPHRWFLCDASGRLITRLDARDPYVVVDRHGHPDPDGDLRVMARALPPPVAAALAFARGGGSGAARLLVSGQPHLVSLLPLAEGRAQQWMLGVIVPESHYVGGLTAARNRLLVLLALVVIAATLAGLVGARTIGRGVGTLVRSTEAMRRFSFAATEGGNSPFREVRAALESVERAKTALRAMVKYVPVALVRRLYESGRDPVLGADLLEISMMFTDIADFTTHTESLSPTRLAEALGRYLQAATRAVEQTGGTVDKYIGDALMVLWNAPTALEGHPRAACEAALACAAATHQLSTSTWWRQAGLPPWRTRFGIHTDEVLVGNFGAPERLSYTAMGDGVNLAARLEGLNKIYGTTILVSDVTCRRAGAGFVFRRVDRVAVKGKSCAVDVHELVGRAGDAAVESRRPTLAAYEAALTAAFQRRFAEALALLDESERSGDGPAGVLASRCRAWLAHPPPPGWDGTWTATQK